MWIFSPRSRFGAKVPADRPFDTLINRISFLEDFGQVGPRRASNLRADRMQAVKWCNWKLHFITGKHVRTASEEPRADDLQPFDSTARRSQPRIPSCQPGVKMVGEFEKSVKGSIR
ncbi:MAG: hypothetical protein R3C05_08395 [Pirellulaceae bacterium]